MKKVVFHVSTRIITAITIVSFFLIFIRLFAKEVLIDALDVQNEVVSFISDYTWGNQLSKHQVRKNAPGYSDEYDVLRKVYDETVLARHNEMEMADTEDAVESISILDKYETKVSELKSDINFYCNHHFILRPFLTDIKLACANIVNWNMAYAQNDGDEYMLRNGVVEQAVTEVDNELMADTSVFDAATRNGANYIYLQYPYRVNSFDSYVPYGAANYSNQNADKYLDSLRASGATVLDLRKELASIGWDLHDGYYLTDKHWKTDSGFVAAGVISKYLSDNYEGFVYHPEYHDKSSYDIKTIDLNNPMIRESVNLYFPKFEANLRYICLEDEKEEDIELLGEFPDTIFDVTKIESGRFSNVLTAYSTSRVGESFLTETKNELDYDHSGTVLYISNSFSWHIIPYLVLDCDKVVFLHIDAIDCAEGIIERIKPDVVIEAPF